MAKSQPRKCPKCKTRKLSGPRASICRTCYENRPRKGKKTYGTCPLCKTAKLTTSDAKRCAACFAGRGKTGRLTPERTCQLCNAPCSKDARFCQECLRTRRSDIEATRVETAGVPLEDGIRAALKAGPKDAQAISGLVGQTPGHVLDVILAMQARGMNLHELGGKWSLERQMPTAQERTFEYVSRPDNTFQFGVASDQHLGSRYAREDVLNDLYDAFASTGCDRVFNAGNWIDGEDEKNRFDIAVHGLEPQVDYLAAKYPQRDGITTYAVWGEDHEGWFSRRESIDVGRFTEGKMRTAGREDWVDLGFVEARIDLINANTGVRNTLVVMHPGGGSSYAYSYRPQKIVESLSGGEKPGVLIIGHYHKLDCRPIRNVWTIQAGCQQDQTVFMRKKGLDAQVGGLILTLEQDPKTGAIFRCVSDIRMYYDRAYYNDRWSKTGPVVQAPRYMGGVKAAS